MRVVETVSVTNCLVQQNHELNHPAWHPQATEQDVEDLLKGQPRFSFVFHRGNSQYAFSITFINKNGLIENRLFNATVKNKELTYKNGSAFDSTDLNEFIGHVMDCPLKEFQAIQA